MRAVSDAFKHQMPSVRRPEPEGHRPRPWQAASCLRVPKPVEPGGLMRYCNPFNDSGLETGVRCLVMIQ